LIQAHAPSTARVEVSVTRVATAALSAGSTPKLTITGARRPSVPVAVPVTVYAAPNARF